MYIKFNNNDNLFNIDYIIEYLPFSTTYFPPPHTQHILVESKSLSSYLSHELLRYDSQPRPLLSLLPSSVSVHVDLGPEKILFL